MKTFKIASSHGTLMIDESGEKISQDIFDVDCEDGQLLNDIKRFNTKEYLEHHGSFPDHGIIDILEIGYWHIKGYEPPEREFREWAKAEAKWRQNIPQPTNSITPDFYDLQMAVEALPNGKVKDGLLDVVNSVTEETHEAWRITEEEYTLRLSRIGDYWMWFSNGISRPYWISDLDGTELNSFETLAELLKAINNKQQ